MSMYNHDKYNFYIFMVLNFLYVYFIVDNYLPCTYIYGVWCMDRVNMLPQITYNL